MTGPRPDQIAVFLDFENLVIGAERALPDLATQAVPYRALDRLTRERGTATVRRAYADWAKPRFGKYQQDLGMNGVDLVQVSRFGTAQENAADIRMAVDAIGVGTEASPSPRLVSVRSEYKFWGTLVS